MQVHQFEKTFIQRFDECLSVLSWKEHHITASQVKTEWSCFLELQIEPTGWQALWKIPRNICEKLKIRYPCIVFGFIEHVNFQDLNCIYNITAVQDESVHLPERIEVALEELYPTIAQENTALNIERTADCIDRLRFFYTHIWMPWDNDNDDDFNWVEKHLESRLKLCFDLRQHNINRPLYSYIHSLIAEGKYIQQKREFLEEDIFDYENDKPDKKVLENSRLTQLMLMHLRLTEIRSHIELLENSDMRPIYEEVKFKKWKNEVLGSVKNTDELTAPSHYVVILPSSVSTQIEVLRNAERVVPKGSSIALNHSFEDVLNTSKSGDTIFLSSGCHMVRFIEYFFNSGQLSGIECTVEPKQNGLENRAVIYSPVSNSSLLVFDGNFTLENIELDCRNILTGIIVKHGTLLMRNCKLIGNGKTNIQQGLICSAYAHIHMDNCILDNFATGVILSENSELVLKDTFLTNCNIGVEMSENSRLKCVKSTFSNCSSCGVYVYGSLLKNLDDNIAKFINLKDFEKYSTENLQISSNCCFENCNEIIRIVNDKNCMVSRDTLDYIQDKF